MPLRRLPSFSATRKATGPVPLSLAPVISVIHDSLLVAVQLHPEGAETKEPPMPPLADVDMPDGLIEYEHAAAWVTVNV